MKKIIQPYPLVTIIGRTNVGKSTIFNRLTENKKAIVSAIPGTTRDQRFGTCFWQGRNVLLSDTAGLDVESDEEIDIKSIKKAEEAAEKTDLILFVVDVRAGILPQDKKYAKMIKATKKPVIVVVNKVDSNSRLDEVNEFYKLGFKKVFAISAKTGAGTGDLLDGVKGEVKDIPEKEKNIEISPENEIRIAIIGKPNVGKSSLINKIIGEERAIVSSIPHTTRDSQDITIEYKSDKGMKYYLTFIDTAGIIKKRKINDKLQEQSIDQSLEMIRKSNLVLLVIDAGQDITMQDKNLAREILENNKSLIFVVNKWDLVPEKTTHSDKEYTQFLKKHFPYLTWAPVVFTSAKTGFKVERLINVATEIYHNQYKQIPQSELNEFLKYIVKKQSPKKTKGTKPPFIHEIRQVGTNPLTFELIAEDAENIHFSYRRFIQNQLRKRYDFMGCGIKLRKTEYQDK